MGSTELYMDLASPVQGQVYGRTHSTTAARYEIPKDWVGKAIVFTSSTADLYVAFGDPGVKAVAAARAVVVGETITPHWGSSSLVPAGASRTFVISKRCTHFSVVSSLDATGYWEAFANSGDPNQGEQLDWNITGKPLLDLNAAKRRTLTLNSGAITVSSWRCDATGVDFAESSAYPDWFDAAAVSSGLVQPGVSFVAGSSEKLVCSDSTLSAALGGVNPFTLFLAVRRTAATANHTIFSVGTGGSNNGRWDVTLNSSEDFVVTRVTSAGASTTSTFATNLVAGFYLFTFTFDGTTPLYWQDRTSQTLSGTAAGDVGTTTKVAVGCRAYNTSTFDQFASAEVARVLCWNTAFSGQKLDYLHAWAKRRFGK